MGKGRKSLWDAKLVKGRKIFWVSGRGRKTKKLQEKNALKPHVRLR